MISGADINQKTGSFRRWRDRESSVGSTPLHLAAGYGSAETAQVMHLQCFLNFISTKESSFFGSCGPFALVVILVDPHECLDHTGACFFHFLTMLFGVVLASQGRTTSLFPLIILPTWDLCRFEHDTSS